MSPGISVELKHTVKFSLYTLLMRVLTLEVSNANPELKKVLSVCIRS